MVSTITPLFFSQKSGGVFRLPKKQSINRHYHLGNPTGIIAHMSYLSIFNISCTIVHNYKKKIGEDFSPPTVGNIYWPTANGPLGTDCPYKSHHKFLIHRLISTICIFRFERTNILLSYTYVNSQF